MNPTGYVKMIMSVLMAAIVVLSVLVPVVYGASTTTVTITNEGAGWAKFAYNDEATDYNIAMSAYGSNLTLGDQTGAADEMIVYASDVFSILYADDSFKLVAPSGASADLGSSAAVASSSGTVTVTDANSTPVYGTDAVTWSYVPDVDGSFGFFTETGKTVKDFPVAAAGSFAGAYAYNEINSVNHSTLAPTYSVADGVFTTGPWVIPEAKKAKDVKEIPIEDVKTKEINENSLIKAVTPEYTDGYWGFNKSTDGTYATIVSYSGPAGDIVIPSSLSDGNTTYPVKSLNSYSFTSSIFPNNIGDFTISLPDTLLYINSSAFKSCNNLTGSLIIPDSVTRINSYAFYFCSGLTGSLIIPDSVTIIQTYAFYRCSGFTGLVVMGSPSLDNLSLPPVSEVLNLGNTSITADANGLPADAVVSDEIPSLGYIAPVSFSETVQNTGLVYTIMSYLPVLIIVGLMVGVLGVFVSNRRA